MASIRLGSVSLDCADPAPLGAFWAALLGGEVAFSGDDFVAVRVGRQWVTAARVEDYVAPTWPSPDVAKQIHLDLAVDDLDAATARALDLGATRPQGNVAHDTFVVLLDPAGHPFCLTTQIPED
jgi:hypothetical protein